MPKRQSKTGVLEFRRRLASRFCGFLPPASNRLPQTGWGRHYLPHYFTCRPSRMHEWIGQHIDHDFDKRGQKSVVVGPRGGAKSTTGTLTTTLRRGVSGRENYIILSSDTVTQAVEHLRNVKEELETNETLAEDYPEACGVGPLWQDKMIQMRNGTIVRAVGTLSRIRGFRRRQHRPSLIIVDDPENDEHIASKRMRDRVQTWFERTLLPMGDMQTNILVMGTSIHRDCLVMRLLRTPGWQSYRDEGLHPAPFKAIVKWPERMDLWAEWEKIYHNVDDPAASEKAERFVRDNHKALHQGVELLWPDREPLLHLMKLRAEMGSTSFEAEKQSNPINPSTCEWPEEYFAGEDIWFTKWPKSEDHAVRVISLDPSKGKDAKHGDFSSFAKLVVDHRGVFYFDIDMERRNTHKIVEDGVAIVRRFRPERLGVESNQFQSLLAEDFADAFRDAQIEVPIMQIDNRVNKKMRIRRLSPLLAQRRIRFKAGSSGSIKCVEQLRDFPNGDHDDGPDSMEMAARMAMDILGNSLVIDDGIGDTLEVQYA